MAVAIAAFQLCLSFTFPADLTKLLKFEVSETNFKINICNVFPFSTQKQRQLLQFETVNNCMQQRTYVLNVEI